MRKIFSLIVCISIVCGSANASDSTRPKVSTVAKVAFSIGLVSTVVTALSAWGVSYPTCNAPACDSDEVPNCCNGFSSERAGTIKGACEAKADKHTCADFESTCDKGEWFCISQGVGANGTANATRFAPMPRKCDIPGGCGSNIASVVGVTLGALGTVWGYLASLIL